MPSGRALHIAASLDGAPLGALVLPNGDFLLLGLFSRIVDLGLMQCRVYRGRRLRGSRLFGRRFLHLLLFRVALGNALFAFLFFDDFGGLPCYQLILTLLLRNTKCGFLRRKYWPA